MNKETKVRGQRRRGGHDMKELKVDGYAGGMGKRKGYLNRKGLEGGVGKIKGILKGQCHEIFYLWFFLLAPVDKPSNDFDFFRILRRYSIILMLRRCH
jgi:hypothetical protein